MACHNCEEICSFCGAENVPLAANTDDYPPAYICAQCAIDAVERHVAHRNGTLQPRLEAKAKADFYALFRLDTMNAQNL